MFTEKWRTGLLMKTIGIDIGTTTISAVVMDTEKRELLTSRTVPNGSFIQTAYEWERIQDANIVKKSDIPMCLAANTYRARNIYVFILSIR